MKTALIAALSATVMAGAAAAQAPAPAAPPPPRAKGPPLSFAVPAAQAAVAACLANTYKVTALITDSAGDAVVLLSGDGANLRTQTIAKT